MSREIKFRAWDKANKEMFQVMDMHFDMQTSTCVSSVTPYPFDQWNPSYMPTAEPREYRYEWLLQGDNEPILMQYTGLVDKNGTEIYEGDIVHTDYFKDNGWNTKVFTGNEPIVFEAGCFRMGDFSTLDECTSNSEYKLEVIGNIYENPELLK